MLERVVVFCWFVYLYKAQAVPCAVTAEPESGLPHPSECWCKAQTGRQDCLMYVCVLRYQSQWLPLSVLNNPSVYILVYVLRGCQALRGRRCGAIYNTYA